MEEVGQSIGANLRANSDHWRCGEWRIEGGSLARHFHHQGIAIRPHSTVMNVSPKIAFKVHVETHFSIEHRVRLSVFLLEKGALKESCSSNTVLLKFVASVN